MDEDHAADTRPGGVRGFDVALILDRQDLGPHDTGVVDPRGQRQDEDHRGRAAAQGSEQKDCQQQKRK